MAASLVIASAQWQGVASAGPLGDPPCAFQPDGCEPDHSYVVKRGDWIWKIARNHLREHSLTPGLTPAPRAVRIHAQEIYAVNGAAIGNNPRRLRPGTVLRLPRPAQQPS